MGTHSGMIVIDVDSIAFIDGIPDTCQHKESDDVFQSASGKWIYWHTYRKWASLTSQARYPLIMEYHDSIGDPIVLGTSQCRKCKKIDNPNSLDYQ